MLITETKILSNIYSDQKSTDKEPKVHGSECLMFGYVGYGMGKKDSYKSVGTRHA